MTLDTYATARAMIGALNTRKISARELLDAHLARNDKIHSAINAVVATDLVRAAKEAAVIDEARARGRAVGRLAGLPITIKDGLDVEGLPAVCGVPALKDRPKSCADATVVAASRHEGAVIWGKTNVPILLSDVQTYNAVYGTTNNPYDVTRVPGGSSGGAAAALAAGVTPLEIGTDIGGSLRHPANFCGVCSLKPTWAVLSSKGQIAPCMPDAHYEADLNVVGPMARNADDLKLLWSILRGTPEQPRRRIEGARVALWNEQPGWPLAAEVKAATERAAKALETAGAHVERARPEIDGAHQMDFYTTLLISVVSATAPDEAFAAWEASREADKNLVAEGGKGAASAAFRLKSAASFREVFDAQVKRQAHVDKLGEFFQRYDAILMPISMTPPFRHLQESEFNERMLDVDGKPTPYLDILDWISTGSALHLPALAVPAGRTRDGLPVGVQVVGPWNGEDRLFDYAEAIEDVLGGFSPPAL